MSPQISQPVPAQPAAVTPDPFWPLYMGYTLSREAFAVWTVAFDAWLAATDRMVSSAAALGWFEAVATNACLGLAAPGTAVAERLKSGGLAQPLLNDA